MRFRQLLSAGYIYVAAQRDRGSFRYAFSSPFTDEAATDDANPEAIGQTQFNPRSAGAIRRRV